MARLAALQPRTPSECLSEWAREEPEAWHEHAARLALDHDAYDPDLHRAQVARYVEHLCGLLHRAGQAGCDLALLPETSLPLGAPQPGTRERLAAACRWAEPLFLEQVTPIARQYRMMVAACYYRAEGDGLFNDAVLVGREGETVGMYHKVHLPCPLDWPMTEAGVFTAGSTFPVFETDIGRVGFLICYDIEFPEAAACLALNGADLILHPTVGYNFPDEEEVVAEARLRARAVDNSLALAYANFGPAPGRSAIYTANGNQVACAGRGVDALAVADVDLRARRPMHWGDLGYEDHRDQLARKRRPDTYGVLTQSRPPLLATAKGPEGRLYEYSAGVGLE